MQQNTGKYLPYLILLVCSVPLFFLNVHNGHSPGGDDYALYIKEAKNIAEGRPFYQTNYIFNKYNNSYSPPQYPPGFPLLLAPVIKIWGIAIKPICYFNSVVAVILFFCFFEFFRKYTDAIAAVCFSVLISYSGILIDLKKTALSDETCLLFVLLYLVFRNAKTFPWYRVVLLILFASLAALIRTQAILLIFAEITIFFLTIIKGWRKHKAFPSKFAYSSPSVFIVTGSLLLNLFLNKVIFSCPSSAPGFYAEILDSTLQKGIITIIRDNVNFFLEAIRSFFHYETDNSMRTALVTVMESSGLVLCITGFLLAVSRRLSFDDIFFIFSCGLMLYYPIHDARYFLPAIAIVYFYCYTSLEKILPALTNIRLRYIGLSLTCLCLVAGFRYLKNTTKEPWGYVPQQNDQQAFQYIRQHVNDSDIIVCARPRLLTLYTDKKCMIFAWQHTIEENKKYFDSMNVKYLLIFNDIAVDFFHNYINQTGFASDSVNIAVGYKLFTLR